MPELIKTPPLAPEWVAEESAEVQLKLRSEAIQEIISQPPPALVRWGMSLFCCILLLVLSAAWVIKYPDIVKAPFVLTSANAPKAVYARVDGKLVRLLVADNQSVAQGQVLAYLESTARHEEVIALSAWLDTLQRQLLPNGSASGPTRAIPVRSFRDLGEIQEAFQAFALARQQYVSFRNGGFYQSKRALLEEELADLQQQADNLRAQQQLYQEDYALAEAEFNVQQQLWREKVIAPLDFKREQSRLLNKKMPLRQANIAIINNQSAQTAKRKEILELNKTFAEQEALFEQALLTLRSRVDGWKKTHLLLAPMVGRVYFATLLQENQSLKAGQEVLFVGTEHARTLGEVRIPQLNFGKTRVGQRVWVRFNAYPSQEFGVVEGKVQSISQVPGRDSTFLAKVVLPKGLETNYGKKLTYKPGMTAVAEIITEDSRLVERFLYNFRKALQR
ncbi:MAG: HlyD family efflux transporter periplasmic adaptor subunit [Cytophagales bacterium]|nr:HlyD family efflux transporter periplasmic adaptor subunit [Cytophagales bacterium]